MTRNFDQMDQYAADSIRCRVRRLACAGCIGFDEVEDLSQDLTVQYLRRKSAFNPERSRYTTFVACVVNSAIATVLAERNRDKARWQSLECGPHHQEAPRAESAAGEHTEARLAVRQVISGLHPQLRRIAALLAADTPTGVARQLGKSRTSVYNARKAIRRALEAAGFGVDICRAPSGRRCGNE